MKPIKHYSRKYKKPILLKEENRITEDFYKISERWSYSIRKDLFILNSEELYNLNTILNFGRFKGITIRELIDKYPYYYLSISDNLNISEDIKSYVSTSGILNLKDKKVKMCLEQAGMTNKGRKKKSINEKIIKLVERKKQNIPVKLNYQDMISGLLLMKPEHTRLKYLKTKSYLKPTEEKEVEKIFKYFETKNQEMKFKIHQYSDILN